MRFGVGGSLVILIFYVRVFSYTIGLTIGIFLSSWIFNEDLP